MVNGVTWWDDIIQHPYQSTTFLKPDVVLGYHFEQCAGHIISDNKFKEAFYWTCWSSMFITLQCKLNHINILKQQLCVDTSCLDLSTRRKWIINTLIPAGTVFSPLSIQSERIRRRSGGDAVNQKSGMMRQCQPGQPEPIDGRLDPTKDGWKSRRQTHSIHSQTIFLLLKNSWLLFMAQR